MHEIPSAKRTLTLAIKKHLDNENWPVLDELMAQADKYGCAKSLRKAGWISVGEYRLNSGRLIDAIVAYNQARIVDCFAEDTLIKLAFALNLIYKKHEDVFSRQDLRKFEQLIERFINFYEVNGMGRSKAIVQCRVLLKNIQFKIYDASWLIETPATHAINHIYDALYSDMTPQETWAELARIVAPSIRDIAEKLEKEKKDGKKKGKPKRRRRKRE
jgi:hypothetical protein